MVTATSASPVLLIAAAREHSLAGVLQGHRYAVVEVHTGTLALEWARDVRPDTIIVEADLPDMSGIDACRLLHGDPRIGHRVPILILAPDKPTPEQRVTALRAGAWDFLRVPRDAEEFSLTLQTYVQAKRNIDVALAEGPGDAGTGVLNRAALARRARELGALMARRHGGLACVVFALDGDLPEAKAGSALANATRASDVVGALGPTEFAVLAPGTDHAGAVKLAQRVAAVLCAVPGGGGRFAPVTLRAGYDAVVNLKYSPIDPVELLTRASAAVRHGKPEPEYPWVRCFDVSRTSGPERPTPSRQTPPGIVSDTRSTSS